MDAIDKLRKGQVFKKYYFIILNLSIIKDIQICYIHVTRAIT